jgi:hypothetical protein
MQTMQCDSLMLFGMFMPFVCGVQALPHQGVTLMKAPWPSTNYLALLLSHLSHPLASFTV